jgi:hypothetical protein
VLPPVSANSTKGLGRVRLSSVFQRSCNGGMLNTTLQISLLCRNQYLVASSRSEYIRRHFGTSLDVCQVCLVFFFFSQCSAIMLGVFSFCSVFSILLDVFFFA